MLVYILSQLHAVSLKVAVFKNNQTFFISKIMVLPTKSPVNISHKEICHIRYPK